MVPPNLPHNFVLNTWDKIRSVCLCFSAALRGTTTRDLYSHFGLELDDWRIAVGLSTVTSSIGCDTFVFGPRSHLGSTLFTVSMSDVFTVVIGHMNVLDGPRSLPGTTAFTSWREREILMYKCKTSINPVRKCKYFVLYIKYFWSWVAADCFFFRDLAFD